MKLLRKHFADNYTGSTLYSEHFASPLYSLEQEWRPAMGHPGGTNNNSCVPNGTYQLEAFTRPRNGHVVPLLYNPDLGVYRFEDDLPPEGGRFLILMHPGNRIAHVVGCIASGMYRAEVDQVNDSRNAQVLIMQAFNAGDTELTIESFDTKEIYMKKGD